MTRVFVTSDHHFFHGNIIKYCNRPFKDYKRMNEYMIRQWNKVVKKNDIVLHLGDFAFRGKADLIYKRLNGIIIMIQGNHDRDIQELFITAKDGLIVGNAILTHRPLQKSEIPEGFINIHGHIHNKKSYNGINVSVEMTKYKPIPLDKILEKKGSKRFFYGWDQDDYTMTDAQTNKDVIFGVAYEKDANKICKALNQF